MKPTAHLDLVGALQGYTSDVSGRFVIEGPEYSYLADSSMRGGGPGEQPGTLDLLMGSLVVCALNVLRIDDPADPNGPTCDVECFARVSRSHENPDGLGDMVMEFRIEGITLSEARIRLYRYQSYCRVYRALRASMSMTFVVHADDGTETISPTAEPHRVRVDPDAPGPLLAQLLANRPTIECF